MNHSKLSAAARWIDQARHILVFCGSGLSAESGVPTFRGPDGLYNDAELMAYAHVDALDEKPDAALAWFQQAREMLEKFRPNAGHLALARICLKHDCTIITQNVDGLLDQAIDEVASAERGAAATVWHLHGSLHRAHCHICGAPISPMPDDLPGARCPDCGGRVRPDVVLFGEELPQEPYLRAQAAAHVADVVLLLGTSGIVYPAALIPGLARSHGAQLIEINPNPTELSGQAHLTIRATTGEALPKIEQLLST